MYENVQQGPFNVLGRNIPPVDLPYMSYLG